DLRRLATDTFGDPGAHRLDAIEHPLIDRQAVALEVGRTRLEGLQHALSHAAVGAGVEIGQVLDVRVLRPHLVDAARIGHALFSRGSSASRRPSPTKEKLSMVNASARVGK